MAKKKTVKKTIKKIKKGKRGFTLVELLVVVAIIGLMAAVALVALNSARMKARDARRVADIRQVQTALEMYYMDANIYPSGTLLIGTTSGAGSCLDNAGWTATCGGTIYMARTPSNPAPTDDGTCGSAVSYYYTQKASGASYTIGYCLGATTGALPGGVREATPGGL